MNAHAARHAVGRLHRHRSHAVLAEVLLDFGHDIDLLDADTTLGDDSNGVVDLREAFGELDVDDRADDLHDPADLLCCCCLCHNVCSYVADAPDTTSMISRVIAAWRTLFMYNVRLSSISAEFRVAASIAVICAAKNAAFDSSSAR